MCFGGLVHRGYVLRLDVVLVLPVVLQSLRCLVLKPQHVVNRLRVKARVTHCGSWLYLRLVLLVENGNGRLCRRRRRYHYYFNFSLMLF